MKKKKIAPLFAAMAVAVAALAGCGSDTGADVSADEGDTEIGYDAYSDAFGYDATDYVTLCDYMGLTVELSEDEYTVTDEDVDDYIDLIVLYYPQYTESDKDAVEDGVIVDIDYSGTVDGEETESGEGVDVTIGDNEFPDGFDDALAGAKAGDTVTFTLTYDEDYSDTSLAGKDIAYTVTINQLLEEEELDHETITDEYVSECLTDLGVSTVEELREYLEEDLETSNESYLQSDTQSAVEDALLEDCEVELPSGLLEATIESYTESITAEAEEVDMEFADYLEGYYGMDEDEFNEYVEESIKEEFILVAIINDMEYTFAQSGFDEFVSEYMGYYGYEDEDEFYDAYGGETYVMLAYAENEVLSEVTEAATVNYI